MSSLLDILAAQGLLIVTCASSIIVVFYVIAVRYRRGLRQVPGPFFASLLPLDRLLTASRANQHEAHIKYHRKYGPIVRVGPRHVSFVSPESIHQIYSIHTKFQKSEFYPMWDVKTPKGNIPSTFSTTSEDFHRSLRRPVGAAFALSSILEFEPLADSATATFQQKMDGLQNTSINMGQWLHWYAFDVIGSITFSSQLGFMEKEEDIEGMIGAIEGRQVYGAVIGQFPILDRFLLGNTRIARLLNSIPWFAHVNTARYIVDFAARQLAQRKNAEEETDKVDLVARFKRHKNGVEVMTDAELLSHAAGNVHAGSDTTAITLRAIIYYVCKNPRIYHRLTEEIRSIHKRGELSEFVTYHEASRMTYFQACVKEALRIHPAVGFLLERIVPEGGAMIAGLHLPARTVVGVNPWVIARNTTIYGNDVDDFRPERWLEADETTLNLMEKSSLAFGAGSRSCIGKHIALMEVTKLIPQLFRDYDIELSDSDADWKLFNYWFVRQESLMCRLRRHSDTMEPRTKVGSE